MAAYSLGLTLYNLGQRREGRAAAYPPRPAGRLAWLHAPKPAEARRLAELARRLVEDDGFGVLLTCPEEVDPVEGVQLLPPPFDTQDDVQAFLDHWRPEVIVCSDGELRPAMIVQAQAADIPLVMVDGREPYLLRGRDGWYPGLVRSVLSGFDQVFVRSEDAARAFRKAGAVANAVSVIGQIEDPGVTLPCVEADREALARQFLTRPVWFAAAVPEAEELAVLDAHRAAMGNAHKCLLILAPSLVERAAGLRDRCLERGFNPALRSADEEPEPGIEVYIVDIPDEFGLWYRLAPVTFIGGSLSEAGAIRSPLEAASLGSAIVHGPRVGRHGEAFARLTTSRATRSVLAPEGLALALSDALVPDRTASLAQAAWIAVSDGAEASEMVITALRRLTDGHP